MRESKRKYNTRVKEADEIIFNQFIDNTNNNSGICMFKRYILRENNECNEFQDDQSRR